ncbi:MAG: MobF family relaxase [Elusimicrobiota bacterium]
MLTAMVLRNDMEKLAAYHCRGENYYFKQAEAVEHEIYALTGEFPQREDPLDYVKVHGRLAEALGYKAGQEITEGDFLALLSGKNKAGETVARKHKVKGIDLTFSAPKSVSIVGLLMDKNPAIIKAHDETVLEVMAEVEHSFAVARPTARTQQHTGKMCYATVRDGFSREHDPHLHTHVILMNLTELTDKAGKKRISGLWTSKILQRDFNKVFGELYRLKLATKMRALGYDLSYIKNGEWRLSKVSKELEAEFSRRHAQIAGQRAKGLLDMTAWHRSRRAKDPAMDKPGILADWVARLAKYVVNEAENLKDAIKERTAWSKAAEFSIEAEQERNGELGGHNEAIRWQNALKRATERSATVSKQELVYEYLKDVMRGGEWQSVTYNEVEARLEAQKRQGFVIAVKDRSVERYTSLELIATERDYMRFAGVDGGFRYYADSASVAKDLKYFNETNRQLGRKSLSEIQGQAVVDLLTSKNMINVVQGDAGAGKTSTLKAVAEHYRRKGCDVLGLAMQGVAAKKLADEAGIEAMTLRSYFGSKDQHKQRVLIFDEASMLDSRNAAKLFKLVEMNEDKLILVGDSNQLESISAGRVFERYVDYYGRMSKKTTAVKLVVMGENYRQRNPVLRDAVNFAKQGQMVDSLELLNKNGHIEEVADTEERRSRVASLYDRDTLIIVGTAAARDEINLKIRETLKQEQKLGAEKSYVMTKPDGEGLGRDIEIGLAKGDIICFTRNEYKEYDIRNGEKAEVLDCGENVIKVRTEDYRVLAIDTAKYRNIDYGYVLTTYKSQGQTYNSVVVESDTRIPALIDMRNQYVNITRARDEIKVFTDDIDELKDLAGIKTHARDTLGVPLDDYTLKKKMKELAAQAEDRTVAVQDPPAKLEIYNKYLLKEVSGLDDYTQKYKGYMGALTADLNAAKEIEPEVKRKIAEVLNGKAGTKLIAKYGDEPAVAIYAAICLSQNCDPAALDKYHLPEDVKKRAKTVGKAFSAEKEGGAGKEM